MYICIPYYATGENDKPLRDRSIESVRDSAIKFILLYL